MMRRSWIFLVALFWSQSAHANWSLNLGYQNPVVSTFGVNFLYSSGKWAFEAGIGWVDVNAQVDDDDDDDENATPAADNKDKDDDDNASLHVAGDIDLKYYFGSGGFKPYVQGGFGVGIGASAGDDSGAGAGTGGGFAGLGLWFGSGTPYGYASLNVGGSGHTFVQAGFGFDI
jgi:hypothetical protein